jgi:putative transposase
MLTQTEFESWRIKNEVSTQTLHYINSNIRNAPPARAVGRGNRSLTGKYPSKKMGQYIQWESRTVEGPAVYMMENDPEVLEYYDQPNKINLRYTDSNGRNRAFLYTPDFFVILKNQAGWEEWKTEEELQAISGKQPWRYVKDSSGIWSCPPAEEYAKEHGLFFKVRTQKEINWNLIRNFNFLDSFLRKVDKVEVEPSNLEQIKKRIFKNPSIKLIKLLEENSSEFSADDIYISIIKGLLFVNLNECVLAEPEKVSMFLSMEHYQMYNNLINCKADSPTVETVSLEINEKLLWDEVLWTVINVGSQTISLLSPEYMLVELPRNTIQNLIIQNKILPSSVKTTNKSEEMITDFLMTANEDDYEVANYRLECIRMYKQGASKESDPSPRTIRDWAKKFREAEEIYGNGYLGLIPNHKNRGNRLSRLNDQVKELMNKVIEEEYETKIQKNKTVVYGELLNRCEELGLVAPSYVTFSSFINKKPREEKVRARKGERAAYQEKTFYWELNSKTPRHGDFAFNICHLDHTELDIELVCSQTGKKLGRPYLSLMTDAFTRRILAFYISFESPSYRSCMMILRDCVKRYNRLPQSIVVDNGKEFHSIYFETLLAMYECEVRRRPAAQPRYGSILERLFGTTNTMVIHNLEGNTKIMKDVRQVTKKVNPKTNASWTLEGIYNSLEEFFFDLYDNIEHPSLGQSPKEAYVDSLLISGQRKQSIIKYDSTFEVMTLPSTKTGVSKLQPSLGVKINYIYYWNDEFKNPEIEKTKIKVRFDPYNLGVAYAYVNNRWIKCISQYLTVFNSLTEKELKFLTSEIKKQKQNHGKKFTITAQKIAQFIKDCENNEQYKLLKIKAIENKKTLRIVDSIKQPTEQKFNDQKHPKQEELCINEQKYECYGEF